MPMESPPMKRLLTRQVLSVGTTVPGRFSADRYKAYPLLQ
jgi:hypothetical protein